MTTATKTDAPLDHAARGWRVIPLHTVDGDGNCSCGNRKDCADERRTRGKHPRILEWQKQATTEQATLQRWWSTWPDSNIGVATGAGSGIIVVDVDGDEGADSFRALEENLGPAPHTVEAISGSGSRHLFFEHPGDRLPNSAGTLAPAIDVRGDGGYVVVEPSRHVSGRQYTWNVDHHPDETPFAPLPVAWLAAMRGGSRNGKAPITVAEPIAEGGRNETLFKLACSFRRNGLSESAIFQSIGAVNGEQCKPPLPDSELQKIAKSAAGYEPTHPITASAANPASSRVLDEDDEEHDAREFAARKLKLPSLRRVVKRGGEDAIFDLELDDAAVIRIGSISELRNPRAIEDAIADKLGFFPPHYTPTKFRPIANALLKIAETVDESTPADETRGWIAAMYTRRGGRQLDLHDAENRATVVGGRHGTEQAEPIFRDGDGRVCLRLDAFDDFMHRDLRKRVPARELKARLGRLGFKSQRVEGPRSKRGQKVPSRSFWTSPPGFEFGG